MESVKLRCKTTVPWEALRKVLGLPGNVDIIRVEVRNDCESLEVVVSSPEPLPNCIYKVGPGAEIPYIYPEQFYNGNT